MISPRPEALAIMEAVHGAADDAELIALGVDPRTVLDFSASVNPFGPSPKAVSAIRQAVIDRYPDREARELRHVLASRLGVPPERLIVGNGSSELLTLIGLAYFRPGDAVVVVGPTYVEYARTAALMRAQVLGCDAFPQAGFQIPFEAIERTLKLRRPRALFLCNPNNPTGQHAPPDTIARWVDDFMETLFIVDEAYIEFAPDCPLLVRSNKDNLILVRSLTKAYGLAGLRLGYAIASEEVIRTLCRVRPPWSVSTAAQAAGVAALLDEQYLHKTLVQWRRAKTELENGLQAMGLSPLPSAAPLLLLPVGDAIAFRKRLLQRGVLVRDCSSFQLPTYVRVSSRCSKDNAVFLEAMRSQLARHECT